MHWVCKRSGTKCGVSNLTQCSIASQALDSTWRLHIFRFDKKVGGCGEIVPETSFAH
jgi:hypothetical protein